jgi:hypothetical protein
MKRRGKLINMQKQIQTKGCKKTTINIPTIVNGAVTTSENTKLSTVFFGR